MNQLFLLDGEKKTNKEKQRKTQLPRRGQRVSGQQGFDTNHAQGR